MPKFLIGLFVFWLILIYLDKKPVLDAAPGFIVAGVICFALGSLVIFFFKAEHESLRRIPAQMAEHAVDEAWERNR